MRSALLAPLLRAYRRLDREVEAALIYRWQVFHEDEDALAVITGILPMAVKEAKRQLGDEAVDWDDVTGVIFVALLASLRHFVAGQVRFASYAIIAVRHHVRRWQVQTHLIRPPYHAKYRTRGLLVQARLPREWH